jgi:hypothetical protein
VLISRHYFIFLAALATSACRPSGAARDSTASNSATAAAPVSYGLRLMQGDGFALEVPQEALVDRQVDSLGQIGWRIRAPAQTITATIGTADTTRFTDDRPLYDLTITTGHKPAAQSLKAWGDSLVAAHEAAADALDRGEGGAIEHVAGELAYLRQPTCGDCGVDIFTFARGDRLVEIQYTTDTSEPLGVRKRGIYALILSTFRWTMRLK